MTIKLLNLILSFSIILSFTNCTPDEVPEVNSTEEFASLLQNEMESQNIPTMSVLLFKNDNVLYENYLGKTDFEENIELESSHPFLLASISKLITGVALMQLEEDGLLNLDDNINDYLSFNVNIPNQTENITFRHLLTHTSGIEDSDFASNDQYFYGVDSPNDLGEYLENYLSTNGENYNASDNFYDFEPGTKEEYSNTGTALVGFLVEEISGIGFVQYCNQNIFTPLGMTNTAWRLDEITQTIVQPYDVAGSEFTPIGHYTFTDYPNGGLRSTVRDMHVFLSAFAQAGMANNFQLLSSETVDEMLRLQNPDFSDMGLQIFILDETNNLWGHNGGEQGVSTTAAFNPTTKVGALIFTNHGDADLDDILVAGYKLGLEL